MLGELISIAQRMSRDEDLDEFFSTTFTPSEIIMVARRLRVAVDLVGGISLKMIRRKHSVSISTMKLVDQALTRRLPNYRSSIPPVLKKHERARRRGLARLRRRSPLLALLAELALQR